MDYGALLELCGHERRRVVLRNLADQRRTLTIRDLSEAIVESEHETQLRDISGETISRIRIALHHVHVPKLAAAGLVEYDAERDLVEPTAKFDSVAPHLSSLLDAEAELETPLKA